MCQTIGQLAAEAGEGSHPDWLQTAAVLSTAAQDKKKEKNIPICSLIFSTVIFISSLNIFPSLFLLTTFYQQADLSPVDISFLNSTKLRTSLSGQAVRQFPGLSSTHLFRDNSALADVMHEDPEHLGHNLWQVNLELCAQGTNYLLYQQDDGVLHGTVRCPVILWQGQTFWLMVQVDSSWKSRKEGISTFNSLFSPPSTPCKVAALALISRCRNRAAFLTRSQFRHCNMLST